MEEACADIRTEGWKWIEARLSRDYTTSYGRVWPQGNEGESVAAFDPADIAGPGC